jgi:fatty-acyl-CoA synthase
MSMQQPAQADKVYRSELTPVSFLRRSAYIFPNKTAIIHGDRRYTWREFAERVDRLANGLRAAGLQRGDRVAFLSPNTPPLLEAHFGVPAAGGILVAVNTRLNSAEVGYILQHCGARYLFVDAELLPTVAALDLGDLPLIRIDDTGAAGDPYENFLAAASAKPVTSWLVDEEETIAIDYTSGTTGGPKGVMFTYRGAYLNALANVIEAGMTFDSVYLWTLPMFHCNGWCFPWSVAAVAGTNICLRKVDSAAIWEAFDTQGVTHYCGAPTVQISIANHPSAHRLNRPITLCVAGAPPSPTLLAQLDFLNLRALHVYGLTETYGPITIREPLPAWAALPADERSRLLSHQGQGNVLADLARVVDEQMCDVPRDGQTQGEVVMHGNIVMKGYFANETATADAFRGGWFHSGDIAVWHPDGAIELRDRKKDIIISGGENISTIEVEQAIAKHPAVLECAVVAIPDDRWGERPKAFVTLKPGQAATEPEIIAHCRDLLAHYKCPDAVTFGDLPKTSTGKVQKFVLREREWAGREKRIN